MLLLPVDPSSFAAGSRVCRPVRPHPRGSIGEGRADIVTSLEAVQLPRLFVATPPAPGIAAAHTVECQPLRGRRGIGQQGTPRRCIVGIRPREAADAEQVLADVDNDCTVGLQDGARTAVDPYRPVPSVRPVPVDPYRPVPSVRPVPLPGARSVARAPAVARLSRARAPALEVAPTSIGATVGIDGGRPISTGTIRPASSSNTALRANSSPRVLEQRAPAATRTSRMSRFGGGWPLLLHLAHHRWRSCLTRSSSPQTGAPPDDFPPPWLASRRAQTRFRP